MPYTVSQSQSHRVPCLCSKLPLTLYWVILVVIVQATEPLLLASLHKSKPWLALPALLCLMEHGPVTPETAALFMLRQIVRHASC